MLAGNRLVDTVDLARAAGESLHGSSIVCELGSSYLFNAVHVDAKANSPCPTDLFRSNFSRAAKLSFTDLHSKNSWEHTYVHILSDCMYGCQMIIGARQCGQHACKKLVQDMPNAAPAFKCR